LQKKLLGVLILFLIVGIFSLPTFGADKQFKIAVLPFDDSSIQDRWWSRNWEVGKGVADELVTALLATNKFRLIEREQINKILREQDFGSGGRVDSQSAAKIGKILGVQLLVMGRVTEFSLKSEGGAIGIGSQGFGLGFKTTTARVVIDARLVDTTSAEIKVAIPGTGEKKNTNLTVIKDWNGISFGSSDFKKTNLGLALRDAVNQVATGLATQAYNGVTMGSSTLVGTVFYAKDNKVIINIGSSDEVQMGMVFIVDHIIDVVKDPDTGEVVDEVTEPVAEITVSEVKEKTATCVVTTKLSKKYPIAVKDKVKQK
jgi:curli biogenesis system outer membrane secretion channel CsgG